MTDLAERLDATSVAADHAETKGERTRRRLLEIAVDRFGRRGFRATSVSEIAREAGLTQAAAYAYFDGKDALFAAAVDTDASDLLDQAGAQVEATPVDVLIPTIIVVLVVGLEDHPLTKRVLAGQEPEALPRLVDLPAVERFADRIGGRLAGRPPARSGPTSTSRSCSTGSSPSSSPCSCRRSRAGWPSSATSWAWWPPSTPCCARPPDETDDQPVNPGVIGGAAGGSGTMETVTTTWRASGRVATEATTS